MAFETHVRRPLFDRLVDAEPWQRDDRQEAGSRTVGRTLDRDGLLESVRLELVRLFSTRTRLRVAEIEDPALERTVVDYGVPEVAPFAAANPEDRRRLAAILRITVAAYEPRLKNVEVTVEAIAERPQAVRVAIGGQLRVESVWEPVWFPVLMAPGRAEVEEGAAFGD